MADTELLKPKGFDDPPDPQWLVDLANASTVAEVEAAYALRERSSPRDQDWPDPWAPRELPDDRRQAAVTVTPSRARKALADLAKLRQSTGTRLLAEAEHAYEAALRSAGVKINTRARGRTGRQRQAAVRKAVDAREPLAPWLAIVGITELDLLEHAFDTFRERATRELTQYTKRMTAIVERIGVKAPAFDVEAAVNHLVLGVTAMARQRLLAGDEATLAAAVPKVVKPKLPKATGSPAAGFDLYDLPPEALARTTARVMREALRVVEGHAQSQVPTTPDRLPEVVETVSATTVEEAIGEALVEEEPGAALVWQWVHGFYGDPVTPYDAHVEMDGFETTDRDNDAGPNGERTNDEEWPEVALLYPGDHAGCTCEWVLQS